MSEQFKVEVDDAKLKAELEQLRDKLNKVGIATDKIGTSATESTKRLMMLNQEMKRREAQNFNAEIGKMADKLDGAGKNLFQLKEYMAKTAGIVTAIIGGLTVFDKLAQSLSATTSATYKNMEDMSAVTERLVVSTFTLGFGWKTVYENQRRVIEGFQQAEKDQAKMKERMESLDAQRREAGKMIAAQEDDARKLAIRGNYEQLTTIEKILEKRKEINNAINQAADREGGLGEAERARFQMQVDMLKEQESRVRALNADKFNQAIEATKNSALGFAYELTVGRHIRDVEKWTEAMEKETKLNRHEWVPLLRERVRIQQELHSEAEASAKRRLETERQINQERRQRIRDGLASAAEKRGELSPDDKVRKFREQVATEERIRRVAEQQRRDEIERDRQARILATQKVIDAGMPVDPTQTIDRINRAAAARKKIASGRIRRGELSDEERNKATEAIVEKVLQNNADRGQIDNATKSNFMEILRTLNQQEQEQNETKAQLDQINRLLRSMQNNRRNRAQVAGLGN